MNVKTMSVAAMTTLLMSGASLSPAMAETIQTRNGGMGMHGAFGQYQGNGGRLATGTKRTMREEMGTNSILGTIVSVSGTTLTITGKIMSPVASTSTSATTYTVDASKAHIEKQGAQGTVTTSSIAVGDSVVVTGTITGTNIIAQVIRDGAVPMMQDRDGMNNGRFPNASSTPGQMRPEFQGNGQPVIGGTVSAISGTTLTLSNRGGVSFSVDTSQASIMKQGATTTVSTLAIGDSIIVQGTVNGTSVIASSIVDQGVRVDEQPNDNASTIQPRPAPIKMLGGMFNGVGNFFGHLFGF